MTELHTFSIIYQTVVTHEDRENDVTEQSPYQVGDTIDNEKINKITFSPEDNMILVHYVDGRFLTFVLENIIGYMILPKEVKNSNDKKENRNVN